MIRLVKIQRFTMRRRQKVAKMRILNNRYFKPAVQTIVKGIISNVPGKMTYFEILQFMFIYLCQLSWQFIGKCF